MRKFIQRGFLFTCLLAGTVTAQTVEVNIANEGKFTIEPEIYGQFAEHLGSCIYGGLWVGEDSSIPNTNGYRNDVLKALQELHVPVLRWPGGCFADEYHWMDGIGPRDQRPKMQNNNWGGTIEDNSFGTHEFLNLCELLGCEPYISANVGSGTVEEMAKWVEYMNSEGDTPMARLRRQNGREKAWGVKYLGVGNESWGCGGNMRAEFYADLYRRYQTYARNMDDHNLYKIASGASDYDYSWTRTLMDRARGQMQGLSLHYYTVEDWDNKGKAKTFTDEQYYNTMSKCLDIDSVITRHERIMDEYDPEKRVGLLVDEWGTWWDVEEGTNPGHLYQQNTMRDAIVAGLTLNVFHRHAERVKMANIAQIVNVLQSMILTNKDGGMVLTPTYHVFQMYYPFQGATLLDVEAECDTITVKDRKLPLLSISAAKTKDGKTVISFVNPSLDKEQNASIANNMGKKIADARILTSKNIKDYNDFDHLDTVHPVDFKGAKLSKDKLTVKIPARSIVVLTVE